MHLTGFLMRIGRERSPFPIWAQTLLWAVVAAGYVWLLGPPVDRSEGRQPAEREAIGLVVTDSLLYDPEREHRNDLVVSPRRFTAEALAAVGFPLQDSTQEEVPLAYRQARGVKQTATH